MAFGGAQKTNPLWKIAKKTKNLMRLLLQEENQPKSTKNNVLEISQFVIKKRSYPIIFSLGTSRKYTITHSKDSHNVNMARNLDNHLIL